ncbi:MULTISPECIES: LysR substrate-binding domain-containing protein [Pseudoalteromonas]|jgi:LysR family transcriptional regulator for metE and metH|uniref:HTH-type transcriptional regulator MetR n=4 Tax=Pseudoalteromonas TaxID=53246 RepID=A0A0P7E9R5_9GAMM|nr:MULTISPECIES: LysR substrate-binding domain-containing protein [Pseudoalteromonas]MAH27453.1 LysR family transcriptional regulator [Pseudoalteromonadaceae bacterium]MBR37352.1 LysR family transcriptional regulator [Idiomarina sp.]MDC3191846.1 LysR substrate-binding domain-containing protein [Pseudoalteromonas elyakovii]MED5513862.1 LysR substrate-binding domain-containing protein [Pseudomonadota bacterium]KPM79166.1 transcriptional regulator [Pseudoalteromonas sp. UCD-33C]|tara:strand:- start:22768 stop:23655 length:888 start_codon:yes stop_codon:yes gene_type:complete
MIDIKHLKTIATLKETGSLVNTARELFLTQSALSHQIKDLENKLDCQLFERKTQPVRFTPQGMLLLELANEVLPRVEATKCRLKESLNQPISNLRLSVECHACFHWLLPTIKEFNNFWPDIKIDYERGFSYDAIPDLINDELDLVLTSDIREPDQLEYAHLFDFKLKLIVAPDHELAKKAYVTALDLKNETIISYPIPRERQDIFKHFIQNARFDGTLKTVDQGLLIFQLVSAGMGVAALPDWLVTPYESQGLIKSIPLGALGLTRPMYLAMKKNMKDNPVYRHFLNTCKQNNGR